MISTVHVVFKTHLDLGFTDTAANVTDRYVHAYLPRAIELARELDRRGGSARFVWTAGSWIIHEALRLGTPAEREALRTAIRAGQVAWHGLPLTTHTEVMDPGLVQHGIAIARRLDAEFGRRTIAAKMTDVPGHTLGLVPLLADAGLHYLHLGVNGASAVPEVPEFFRWRAPDGSEVVVNYAPEYGATELGVAIAPGGADALHLAHTGDNFGPPSAEEVEELFDRLSAAYPGATVVASTLDAFAAAVLPMRDQLPVVTQEIGDSWIHGVASDPVLTARLRALLRLRAEWVDAGVLTPGTAECDGFGDALLLVAEHTWGKDLKTFLPDYAHYEKAAFQRARAADQVAPELNPPSTDAFAWAYQEAHREDPQALGYAGFEQSWAEQRAYIDRALDALVPERRALARQTLAELAPVAEPGSGGAAIDPTEEHAVGAYRVRFGEDGALVKLVDANGAEWAGPEHPLAAYRYQTFDEHDEERWLREYCRDLDQHAHWAVPDQSKPGLSIAATLPASVLAPRCVSAVRRDDEEATTVTLRLVLPEQATEAWGAARDIALSYRFPKRPGSIGITLSLRDKDASRLPEASWLGFRPRSAPGAWTLGKLGSRIDPCDVVRNGNRSLHAVTDVAREGERRFSLRPLDTPLVAVGRPGLLRFDNAVADPDEGLHVLLHNNVWGTNFRMWLDDDLHARFVLDLRCE